MNETLIDWVWAQQVFGYGSSKPMELYRQYGSIRKFLESPDFARYPFEESEKVRVEHMTAEKCRELIAKAEKVGMKFLTPDSPEYPICLKEISNPPAVLYYYGTIPPVDRVPSIAVVGSRKCSGGGAVPTTLITNQLAKAGAVVVSGAAIGIDSAAHEGVLSAGGKSVAFFPCGLDLLKGKYPRRMLYGILRKGALVSEFAPGVDVQKWHYRVRNRLISGMSCGVLVAEAEFKSGTMLTARHAVEQSRDVYTLMVSSWQGNSEGILHLLWDGAKPISCAADILVEYQQRFPGFGVPKRQPISYLKETARDMNPPVPQKALLKKQADSAKKPKPTVPLSPNAEKMLGYLSASPISLEELADKSGMSTAEIFRYTTELELAQRVQTYSGRRYALK